MKYIFRLVCLLICLSMVLGLVGCAKESPYPPGYEQYLEVIGETKEDVFKKLKMQESDFTEITKDMLQAPGVYSFCGYDFELYLKFDRATDRLYGFKYSVFVDDLSGLPAMREKLLEIYGDPSHAGFSEDYFERLMTKKKGNVADNWSLFPFTEEIHPELAKIVKESYDKRGYGWTPAWNFNWAARYREDAGKFSIIMDCAVGPDQTIHWEASEDQN